MREGLMPKSFSGKEEVLHIGGNLRKNILARAGITKRVTRLESSEEGKKRGKLGEKLCEGRRTLRGPCYGTR